MSHLQALFSRTIVHIVLQFFVFQFLLVRCSNPHLSFNRQQKSRGGCRLHGKPSRRALSSFKKCCTSNALDGSEDDILWEGDGEDKDDSDWMTDNDSVMSDDGESDE